MSEEDMALTRAEREHIESRIIAVLHDALSTPNPRNVALYLENAATELRRVTRRVWERALD